MHKFLIILFLAIPILVNGQKKFAKGLIFDEKAYNSTPIKANLTRGDYTNIPSKFSLKQYCPKPGNQLQLHTSAAWAITWGARTILEAKSKGITDQTEITKNAFAPSFTYSLSTQMADKTCIQGTSLEKALEVMKTMGTPKYVDFLEFCPKTIPESSKTKAEESKITDYVRLFKSDDEDKTKLETVKRSLAEGLPVVVGMECPDSFHFAEEFWQPREQKEEDLDGHALCLVGYDDGKFGGAFEAMNSWGKGWGNDGFIWIRYEDFLEFVPTAYELFIIGQDEGSKAGFSGEISCKLLNGNDMSIILTNVPSYYKTTMPYPSGTSFRIYIQNNQTAYVYVLGTDLTGKFFTLFPTADVSPILNYNGTSIALPGEKKYIKMDKTPGKDFLAILYSKEELDYPKIKSRLEKSDGRIDERVSKVLKKQLVDNSNISWTYDKIQFEGKGEGKTIVPVFIEIEHK
ncbi:C1 family peptidase [Bacteroidota bacterium]